MELEGKEAKLLGSLARDGGIDKAIGKKQQILSIWRRLLSGMRERYPFSEDFVFYPSKWTNITESQNGRVWNLCGSSSPIPLLKQGLLQQAAQDLVQVGLEYLQ